MITFKNLKDVLTRLKNEDVCRAFLEQMRWNGEPFCPHCNCTKPYKLKDGKTYRCRDKRCKKDFTVTVGTIFENSKIPLSTWVAALYLASANKKGISSCQLSRHLGITQKTAWFILGRIRLIMDVPKPKLEGIVEVDETYMGGEMKNKSKSKRQRLKEEYKDTSTPVMGMIARDGKVEIRPIGNMTFKEVVRGNVDKKAIVVTDSHNSYTGLDKEYAGHETVNHSQEEWRRGIYYTNTVEGVFAILKRTIYGTYHQASPKHMFRYCAEVEYRYNTRKMKDGERFDLIMSNIEGRLKYKDLIKKPTT